MLSLRSCAFDDKVPGVTKDQWNDVVAGLATPPTDDQYNALLNGALELIGGMNARLVSEYGIGSYARWSVDQTTGEIVFSDDERECVRAEVDIVGTLSTEGESFKWAWANPTISAGLSEASLATKALGERHQIPDLVAETIDAGPEDAMAFSAVACLLSGGEGVYRAPAGKAMVFMALRGIRRV